MTLEREEIRREWCQLVSGAIEDFSYDPERMFEELQEIVDDDNHGFFYEPETFFMIANEIFDDHSVQGFFLGYIQEYAPENLDKILDEEPELILILNPESLTEEQKKLKDKVMKESDYQFKED